MRMFRLRTLLALLLVAGGVTLQAQDTTDFSTDLFDAKSAKAVTHSQDFNLEYSEWLYYDNGNYYTNVAYMPENIPFSWAVAFPSSMLQSYEGHVLTKVALFENDWNTGDLRMSVYYGEDYMPRTLMAEQIVTPLCEWWFHEIELETPIDIDTTKYLWIVFSELTVTETYSAACSENLVSANSNARWVQFEENKWMDMGETDDRLSTLQFMIRAYVTDPWGIEKQLVEPAMEVYPNPGGNTLNIRTVVTMGQPYNARVEIYDLSGKLICNQEITENVTSINAEWWPSGMYVWKVVANGEEVETGKWIKQ